MKRILTVASFVVLSLTVAQAQEKKEEVKPKRLNNIKANIFSPVVSTASLFYERAIGKNTTAQLGLFYTGYSNDDLKLRGFGITPEFRYYASETKGAMQGFYVAPFLRYQQYEITEGTNKGKLSTFGGGLLIGNQWMFGKGINLDVFVGPTYNSGNVKVTAGSDNFDLPVGVKGFGVRSGVTIGIAF